MALAALMVTWISTTPLDDALIAADNATNGGNFFKGDPGSGAPEPPGACHNVNFDPDQWLAVMHDYAGSADFDNALFAVYFTTYGGVTEVQQIKFFDLGAPVVGSDIHSQFYTRSVRWGSDVMMVTNYEEPVDSYCGVNIFWVEDGDIKRKFTRGPDSYSGEELYVESVPVLGGHLDTDKSFVISWNFNTNAWCDEPQFCFPVVKNPDKSVTFSPSYDLTRKISESIDNYLYEGLSNNGFWGIYNTVQLEGDIWFLTAWYSLEEQVFPRDWSNTDTMSQTINVTIDMATGEIYDVSFPSQPISSMPYALAVRDVYSAISDYVSRGKYAVRYGNKIFVQSFVMDANLPYEPPTYGLIGHVQDEFVLGDGFSLEYVGTEYFSQENVNPINQGSVNIIGSHQLSRTSTTYVNPAQAFRSSFDSSGSYISGWQPIERSGGDNYEAEWPQNVLGSRIAVFAFEWWSYEIPLFAIHLYEAGGGIPPLRINQRDE